MNEHLIFTGEISKSLDFEEFRHLKSITFTKKGQFWQIEKVFVFFPLRQHKNLCCKTDLIEELKWKNIQYTPYSPDLPPTDFHLLRPLLNNLNDQKLIL